METPILFCIFNRPEITQRTFDVIRRQRPRQLFVVCDGPRSHNPEEERLVFQTRQVIEQVDWPCDVITNFSSHNLGCKYRMSTGISWAFQHSERLIILEDDCLPNDSFFRYCEKLLERFADNPEVMMISGDNFQSHLCTEDSYYFSKFAHIWGWASWQRAWSLYDVEMTSWPQVRCTDRWTRFVDSDLERQHWVDLFDRQHAGLIDTWDFPWMYSCWYHNGLCALPQKNLVSNLGFLPDATHTTDQDSKLACMPNHDLQVTDHPDRVVRHTEADRYTWETIFKPAAQPVKQKPKRSFWQRIKRLAS